HVYIGVRLLMPLPHVLQAVGVIVLAACYAFMPKGWVARETGHAGRDLVRWIAMGFFSWAFVLTVLRDAALGIAALMLEPAMLARAVSGSALAVLAAMPVVTLAGYYLARRVAPVVDVRGPIAGLPA